MFSSFITPLSHRLIIWPPTANRPNYQNTIFRGKYRRGIKSRIGGLLIRRISKIEFSWLVIFNIHIYLMFNLTSTTWGLSILSGRNKIFVGALRVSDIDSYFLLVCFNTLCMYSILNSSSKCNSNNVVIKNFSMNVY